MKKKQKLDTGVSTETSIDTKSQSLGLGGGGTHLIQNNLTGFGSKVEISIKCNKNSQCFSYRFPTRSEKFPHPIIKPKYWIVE